MRVLVACEFSGVVRDAFIRAGHDAWSCDLLPSEAPGPHLESDVTKHIGDGWDLMIAHPPCTYLSNMSNCRAKEAGRMEGRKRAMQFFMAMVDAPIAHIAVENPRGFPERDYRRADQIIQPYHFGHPESKATCLWLKNLPRLTPTKIVNPNRKWDGRRWRTWVDTHTTHTSKRRSVTFHGIAEAMAEQWGRIAAERTA